ncbi:hypothetical protein RR32_19045 (plasmid) [Acinetobacter nosocomialis]|nr:hypothetical protein RR32_19045 [Acinetobacter nosocomialis]
MPKSSKIPRIRKIRKQNTSILNQKNLVPVKLGKKNIIIAGIKKPVMISTLIIIFCMSVPPKTNKPHLLAGRYF